MRKLILVQQGLKVPKGNYNSFGRYKYRSAEDILEAVKPILIANNCLLTISDELIELTGKVYVKSTAKFLDGENEFLTFGFAETSEHKGMSSEQSTGTASSYARKYALNGLFLIDETESDADYKTPPIDEKKITLDTLHPNWLKIQEGIKSGKFTINQLKEKYKVSSEIEKLLK